MLLENFLILKMMGKGVRMMVNTEAPQDRCTKVFVLDFYFLVYNEKIIIMKASALQK